MKRLLFLLLLLPGLVCGQVINTIAGNGTPFSVGDGGAASAARIGVAGYIVTDTAGNFYFSEGGNKIRKISASGIITSFAGTGTSGFSGDGGPATAAQLNFPQGLCIDRAGNLFIAETYNNRVRKINLASGIISTVAGNGSVGFSGDGGAATAAAMYYPFSVAVDTAENLYISDNNNRIRKVDTAGIITTIAGTGTMAYSGDGGPATAAALHGVEGMRVDYFNNLLISSSQTVRKINLSTGIITTIAGDDTVGYTGDGGPATAARIYLATDVLPDISGNFYISERYNHLIRKVDSAGIISTLVGIGSAGFSGDGGAASTARLSYPIGITFDKCGDIVVIDQNNFRIRKITFPLMPTDTPNVSISASFSDTVCLGTSVTYTATFTGGGTITSYQWYVNSSSISGATDNSYSFTPANGDSIDCIIATWNRCSSTSYATSNTIHMVVFSPTTPSVTVVPSPNDTVCVGTPVTYTASTTHGGSSPSYQWVVNGSFVGTGGSTYTYTPANGDSVRCILHSSDTCVTSTTASSNTVHMVVNSYSDPAITITVTPNDTVCSGTTVTYSTSISGGGSTPGYHWLVNGVSASSSSTYTYTPSNGDSVSCILTSSYACVSSATVSSMTIHMTVIPLTTPSVSISVSPDDTVCAGMAVSFSASGAGTGISPVYHWYLNGSITTTGSAYSLTPSTGDSVSCTLLSSATCPSSYSVNSNTIHMVVLPFVTPSIAITPSPNDTVCGSTAVTFTSAITSGGISPMYQWKVNGLAVGTSTTAYSYTPANGDSIQGVLVSNEFCTTSAIVNSNIVHIVVEDLTHPTISLSAPMVTPIGSLVTITATVAGAGSGYTIHWYNFGAEFTTTTMPSVTYTKTLAQDSISAKIVSNDFCYDSTVSVGVVVGGTASIPPAPFLQGKKGVTCYPNPVRNELHVFSEEVLEHVVITNLVGQVVYTSNLINEREFVLPVEGFAAGVYFVKVGFGDGSMVVDRFVKE